MEPRTHYTKTSDGVNIAYQVLGDGPLDLVAVPSAFSHVEAAWEEPSAARMLRRLASFSRLICLDKRGTGLSDRVSGVPTLEERMDDVRAVMGCACAMSDGVRPLGIEVRAGLHTGECQMMGADIGGIAVHIASRVASMAAPSEVLVSSTVKDLVAGSGIGFHNRGAHHLKGVPEEWRLFAVRERGA